MTKYLKRVADEVLAFRLRSSGAVLITGPKWCGKSTTALQAAKSSILFRDGPSQAQNIALARALPDEVLRGRVPRLLDEWQLVPFMWDEVRTEVDRRGEVGQFILTGSSVPVDDSQTRHSGTGRIARFMMRPMSLWESIESTGEVSLEELFTAPAQIGGKSNWGLRDYAYLVTRGGWPQAIGLGRREALQQAVDYYDGLVESDMIRVDGVKRTAARTRAFFRSYARLVTSQSDLGVIKADMSEHEGISVAKETVANYVEAARKLYVIEELEAWNPVLMQKNTVRKTATRHFVDPSIACAALGIAPDDLINDLHAFGYLFESLAVRDLRVYVEALGGSVAHFHDRYGLETDAVVRLRNGSYGLVEVKLFSQENIDAGAVSLLKLAAKIDDTKMKRPSFLAVITGTEFAYRRDDGVYVVPLGCLRP